MEKMNDLSDLLKHEIEDLYSVENQIIEALPKMIEKANNKTLKDALSEHLRVTQEHKNRLDKIQKTMKMDSEKSNGKKGFLKNLFGSNHECKGMKGIIEEGNKIMGADISTKTLDAAIIACAQKVEHYEICGYGTARTYARELGLEPVAKLLEQTLNEEYEADDKLTALAIQRINMEAETSQGGDRTASGASKGRTGREQTSERTMTRERTMEPVSNSRTASAGSTSGRGGDQKAGQPKASSAPRSSGGRTAATKKASSKSASAKTSRTNGRSTSGGRGSSSRSSGR
jgi:ferritin-like metal-binding protein YciE